MSSFKPPNLTDDYELGSLFPLDRSHSALPASLHHEAIKVVTEEFLANLERVSMLAFFVPFLAEFSAMDQYTNTVSYIQVTGKIPLGEETPPEVQAKVQAQVIEHQRVFAGLTKAHGEELTKDLFRRGVVRLNEMLHPSSAITSAVPMSAIQALLPSLVIGLWTAFEVCVTDLWVSSVNHGPKRLAKKIFAANNLNPDSETSAAQAKQMPIRVLENYDYDLRLRMGELLKDTKKVEFQSLKSTRIAYEAAFEGEVKELFSEADPLYANIMVLSAIRNAILHNSGRVDKDFNSLIRKAVGTSLTFLRTLTLNAVIPVKGGTVSDLFGSVTQFIVKLALFVDREMARD